MHEDMSAKATLADLMIVIAAAGLGLFAWLGVLPMPAWRGVSVSLEGSHFWAMGLKAL
jgi:hypothetical protein